LSGSHATAKKLPVLFTPGVNHTTVAEHTFGLMIAIAKHFWPHLESTKSGGWKRITGSELAGKTIAVLGIGRIGKEVVKRAVAFDMKPIAFDVYWDHVATNDREFRFFPHDDSFNTAVPAHPNRWKSIYIHHTRQTGAASAAGGDHFVIGNGDGDAASDGQIQFTQRWNMQEPADPAPGCTSVEATCVSIGLVGDFDRTAPTPTQLKRLEQLVHTLQEHFRIASPQVWIFDQPDSPAGVGRYFPAAAFEGQLLR